MYEEFDEGLLVKIRQKVEALRSGKAVGDADTVMVDYPPRAKNILVLEGLSCAKLEDPVDHQYEDIDKDYKQRFSADTVYQNFSNANNCDQNTYAIDNIYESLPEYEKCMEGRGETTETSTRYYQWCILLCPMEFSAFNLPYVLYPMESEDTQNYSLHFGVRCRVHVEIAITILSSFRCS